MNPIERAARALCELEGNPPGATMDGKPLWRDYLLEVRVVLAATSKPTPKMPWAGTVAAGDRASGAEDKVYTAMIEALLDQE
mgnify:CR=1 FL=1